MKNGDIIKLTYLTPCINGKGSPNPYIGMQGEVKNFNGKTFSIFTGSSWLVYIDYAKTEFEVIKNDYMQNRLWAKPLYFENKKNVFGSYHRCMICHRIPSEISHNSDKWLDVWHCPTCNPDEFIPTTWWQNFLHKLDNKKK